MKRVYKYKLNLGNQTLSLPFNSKILSAVNQNNEIFIYALVDMNTPVTEKFDFLIVATGQDYNNFINDYVFLNTVCTYDELFWHVFYSRHNKCLISLD
jgi:hypothetical protein